MSEDVPYLGANVAHWQARGEREVELARRMWTRTEPSWGIFDVPESTAHLLPADLAGKRAVELGCGTGYISCWLARAGAFPVGVDPTPGQLQIARMMQDETGVRFPLVRAAGERVPLRSGGYDLVISEYGAAIWADPDRWIAEAARLLRSGGELVFLGNSTLVMLCVPDTEGAPVGRGLLRAQRGMRRFEWPDDDCVEFHLSPGDWIRLLRCHGFDVLDLIELYAAEDDVRTRMGVSSEWAHRWPVEEVWRARKQ
jgi:SAM-dependent methyltransferase